MMRKVGSGALASDQADWARKYAARNYTRFGPKFPYAFVSAAPIGRIGNATISLQDNSLAGWPRPQRAHLSVANQCISTSARARALLANSLSCSQCIA